MIGAAKDEKDQFEETLKFLYTVLPSNATIVKQLKSNTIRNESSLVEMNNLVNAMGWSLDELEKSLNIIHVAGTKGKGSVCAFTESLLRHGSIRTGLFTSPHLVSPCERIRINGRCIGKDAFCRIVKETADRLQSQGCQLPGFFRFMLLVALAAFKEAQVEAAILEVGIGGRYDATNIFTQPIATAITELGMDHIDLLGDTLSSIAWHKAGIIKPGITVFSVNQKTEAMQVVEAVAQENRAPLKVISTDVAGPVGIHGDHQLRNAAMALEIAQYWMNCTGRPPIEESTVRKALLQTSWPGRHQIVERGTNRWFIDGAHTVESMELTAKWFLKRDQPKRSILLFHCSEDRNYEWLLEPLEVDCFEKIIFAPPPTQNNQQKSANLDRHLLMARFLVQAKGVSAVDVTNFEQAMQALEGLENCDILVTGSLYIVGAVLDAFKVKIE